MKVRSNSGYIETYDKQKIIRAITEDRDLAIKKGKESNLDEDAIKKVASKVTSKLNKMEFEDDEVISSDTVRGIVVGELYRIGEKDVANISEIVGPRLKDVLDIWGIDGDLSHDNANLDSSNQETMHKRCADIVASKAMLKMLPDDLVKLHLDGSLHYHDREYFFTRQFCFDSDLRYIFYYGLYPDGTGANLPVARAAQSAEVAMLHAAKALGCSQCNCAGGQGYNSFTVLMAPYLEGKSYNEIKQLSQMFIYEMSQMIVARGAQPVFSSIQLYPGVPSIWKDKPVVYKGNVSDRKYGEFERECRLFFKALMEIYYSGDIRGRPFNFPKPEVVIVKEFLSSDIYNENMISNMDGSEIAPSYRDLYKMAFRVSLKNGAPYYENQYHVENPLKSLQCVQCCSYGFVSDEESDPEFVNKMNFIDGAHLDNLGSMQVVSLNLPRAAYYARNMSSNPYITDMLNHHLVLSIYYLRDMIDKAVEIFKIKKEMISKQKSAFMRQTPVDPNDPTKHAPPLCDIDKLSYVIGLVGLNEYVQVITGKQLHESDEAIEFGMKLVSALNLYCGKVGHEANMSISLARTPAETTAQRFAVSDMIKYPDLAKLYVKGDIKKALEMMKDGKRDVPIQYSNGTHCTVDAPISIQRKAEIEGKFFEILKGGNIFHIFLSDINPFFQLSTVVNENGERIPWVEHEQDVDDLLEFGLNIAKNTPITYFAFSKDMTICLDCNSTTSGLHDRCPICKSDKLDHVARITGYYGAVSGFNEAKKEELKMRKRYDLCRVG